LIAVPIGVKGYFFSPRKVCVLPDYTESYSEMAEHVT